jgi:hypothetical protein
LRRLDVETVYVAGGDRVVPPSVEADIATRLGVDVVRLAGANRLETAADIAREVASITGSTDVLLARADTFADALSASNLAAVTGAPLLLTPRGGLSPATATALEDIGAETAWIIGGESAVLPQVEDDAVALGLDVERLAGADRYLTALAVGAAAEAAGLGVMPTIVASGATFPDALAAGPAAANLGGRLLLANPRPELDERNAALLAELESDADPLDLVYLAGGGSALPFDLDGVVLDAIRTDEEAARAASPAAATPSGAAREALLAQVDEG